MAPSPIEGDWETFSGLINVGKCQEILRLNGIRGQVVDVIISDPSLPGEGMSSQTRYVTVKLANARAKPLNWFVKFRTSEEVHGQIIEELRSFKKESLFLMKYVPAAQEYCRLKGQVKLLDIYPKCYYGDEEMIVLENLATGRGYAVLDKEEKQDLKAARMAIKTLAKHHAISYAMIKEAGSVKRFFKRFTDLDFESYRNPYFMDLTKPLLINGLSANLKILEKIKVRGGKGALVKLKMFEGQLSRVILDAIRCNPKEDNLLVLNHGDYWNGNMMFLKDKSATRYINHVTLDFQITRYNSFSLDLGYYLYTSVQGDVRRARLRSLLKLYLDAFKKVSSNLGHVIELTYEQLFLEYRKKFQFGFWWFLCASFGAGLAVLKEIDKTDLNDTDDWPVIFDRVVERWVEQNPDRGKAIAEELVKLVKEYNELTFSVL